MQRYGVASPPQVQPACKRSFRELSGELPEGVRQEEEREYAILVESVKGLLSSLAELELKRLSG
jgi:hypothetical protein